jgi:hypothetical protein
MSDKQSRQRFRGNDAKIEAFGILFGGKRSFKKRESPEQGYPGLAKCVVVDFLRGVSFMDRRVLTSWIHRESFGHQGRIKWLRIYCVYKYVESERDNGS